MDDIISWAHRAPAGASTVYFTGALARSRMLGLQNNSPPTPAMIAAAYAWDLYRDGAVLLTQRRVNGLTCEYIATRTKRAMRKAAA